MTDPIIQKLTKRAQFLFVRGGLRFGRGAISVEARKRSPTGAPGQVIGIGFTASKKVGGAVERNRAKRRLREAARQLLGEYGVPGVDYVIVARPAAVTVPWEGLLDDTRNALIRLRADLAVAGSKEPRTRRDNPTESD